MHTYVYLFRALLGEPQKKVLFLVAQPLRPLPTPLDLVAIGTFFFRLK